MENLQKYNAAFIKIFAVNESQLSDLAYQSVDTWDSVGHMALMAELEESFDLMLETDDIVDFSSYEKGKQILGKYQVSF